MTLIVDPKTFVSKAALKEALEAGTCLVTDPSIMNSWTKRSCELPVGFSDVVTNHPKRTKFAKITHKAAGVWEVK